MITTVSRLLIVCIQFPFIQQKIYCNKDRLLTSAEQYQNNVQQTYCNFHLLFSVRSASESVQRSSTNSEDRGSLKAKDQSPNPHKDKAAGKKSSDSGEEADKDLILIWVSKQQVLHFPLEEQLKGDIWLLWFHLY